MKQIALSLLLLLIAASLVSQIQVLPDMEVIGESNVKIFLYKKALPYSRSSAQKDSVRAYLPKTLPEPEEESTDTARRTRNFIHAEASSLMNLDAEYRYTPINEKISAFGLGASLNAPKGNLLSNHFRGFGDFVLPGQEDISLNFKYYDADGNGLNSAFASISADVYKDIYSFKNFSLRQVATSFEALNLKQRNQALSKDIRALNIKHHSKLDLADFDLENSILLYGGSAAWKSNILVDVEGLEESGLNLIYDGENFLPIPGFHWRYITDFDQQLSIVQNPETRANSYATALDLYRWVFFNKRPSALPFATTPLNLSIRLEDYQPTTEKSLLRSFKLENVSSYTLNRAVVSSSMNPQIPMLSYNDVFCNESTANAVFGQGRVTFEQSVSMNLAFLSDRSWSRVPYQPLLNVESSLKYLAYPYSGTLSLNQDYFAKDHQQKDLPEILDLSLSGAYEFQELDQLYLKLSNLLDSDIRKYSKFPKRGFSIELGIKHRF